MKPRIERHLIILQEDSPRWRGWPARLVAGSAIFIGSGGLWLGLSSLFAFSRTGLLSIFGLVIGVAMAVLSCVGIWRAVRILQQQTDAPPRRRVALNRKSRMIEITECGITGYIPFRDVARLQWQCPPADSGSGAGYLALITFEANGRALVLISEEARTEEIARKFAEAYHQYVSAIIHEGSPSGEEMDPSQTEAI